jgi:hypothetical protein
MGCGYLFLPGERLPEHQQHNPLPHTRLGDYPHCEMHRLCWQVSVVQQCRRVQQSCRTAPWASWLILSYVSSTPSFWNKFNSTMAVFEEANVCTVQEHSSWIVHKEIMDEPPDREKARARVWFNLTL